MKKLFQTITYFIIAFLFAAVGTSKAQSSVLMWNFESNSIGDSLTHLGWSQADAQTVVANDPVTSGNKVLKNTIKNYNAAPFLRFILPSGKTLANFTSFTFKGYFAQGDVGYKTIIVEAYQKKPTAQFLKDTTAKIGSITRSQMGSTAWENITITIPNTSVLKDTIYIAFGINCAGTGNVGGTGVPTIWYADDVTLVPKQAATTNLATNGSFESSNVGVVTGTDVKGWVIQSSDTLKPAPVFEIVSDSIEDGTRALKVSVFGTSSTQWDIQAISDSIPVKQGTTYNYSVWAKAQKSGAQVNFTIGSFSTGEYAAIRPATLTTKWQKFTLTFKMPDNQAYVRAPIHFSYSVNKNNVIYIDNLQMDSVHINTSNFYQGPPLAQGLPKFLGNVWTNDNNFANYWNQITPGNEGKWGSVGTSTDTTKWNWAPLDNIYNYAKKNNLIYKHHNLIWGSQQPSWISAMDSATQLKYIQTWIRQVGARYPNIDMVDVVNEPLLNHNRPDGSGTNANYIKALGGTGKTGWDWVITAFTLARQYLPHAKLLINDFNIINSSDATSTYTYVINLLKSRGLIDGIGVQAHNFEIENTAPTTLTTNLNTLAATGLPIYLSEVDMGNTVESGTADDSQQLAAYKRVFPSLWQNYGVKGVTLWGYIEGTMWQPTCFLVHSDGTWRPAMTWMAQYIKDNPTGVKQTADAIPSDFKLEQNYPNPFNPTTNIGYSILNTTKVTLKIYDVLGREIKTLVNSEQKPGRYNVIFDARNLSSGVYFYKLSAGNFIASKKLMLIK